jgi:lysine 6-dehydrogenase
MGYAVAFDLVRSVNVEQVIIADSNRDKLAEVMGQLSDSRVVPVELDVTKTKEVARLMSQVDVVIACISYEHNYPLAKIALSCHTHFIDLGGNEEVVAKQFMLHEIAEEAGVTIIPDLGLAPGLVSLLAVSAAVGLEEVYEMRMRVGGLPVDGEELFLNYAQVFSVDGLINEYVEDCTVIRDGKLQRIASLEELEELEFPRPFGKMEAFTTSGGTSTLPQSYLGRVQNLDYKTIRYPGHCAAVKVLKDLGLMSRQPVELPKGKTTQKIVPRDLLHHLLEHKLAKKEPDVVLVRVTVTGTRDRQPIQFVWDCIDYADQGSDLTAMMRMTAFPASIVAQMIARGDISARGVLRQENHVPIKLFLAEMDARGINLVMTERAPVHH